MPPQNPPPRRRFRVTSSHVEGRRIEIRGTVQGVGFRPWVYRLAAQAGVTGRVRNDGHGVTIDAFGPPEALAAFISAFGGPIPPAARIVKLDTTPIPIAVMQRMLFFLAGGPIKIQRQNIL